MLVLVAVLLNPLTNCIVVTETHIPGLAKIEIVPFAEHVMVLQQHPGVQYITSKRAGEQGWYAPRGLLHMGRRTGDLYKIPLRSDQSPTTPSGLQLSEHQMHSVSFLRSCTRQDEGKLLAADMGLGKTIAALQAQWEDGFLHRPGLVVGPSLGKSAWSGPGSDPERHFQFGIIPLAGVKAADTTVLRRGGWFFVHYDILEAWQPWISAVLRPASIIFDEVHLLGNPKTRRFKATVSLSLQASVDRRIGLTGTPIPNMRAELWPIMRVLQPRQWGTKPTRFWMRYCGAQRQDDRGGGHWEMGDDTNTLELRARLAGDYLRYTKYDVGSVLPPMTRHRIPVDDIPTDVMERYWLAERAIKKYLQQYGAAAMTETVIALGDVEIKVPKKISAQPGAWRIQAMNVMMGLLSEMKRKFAPPVVFDVLNKHDLVVVFCQRRESASELVKSIRELAPEDSIKVFGPVDGEVPHHKRQEMAIEFAQLKGTGQRALYIATIGAAGICINPLAAASAGLFVDLWWRPCDLLQAEARIERIGQTADHVDMYYLVVPDTMDDHVLALLDEKARAIAEVSPNDTDSLGLSSDLSPMSSTNGEADLDTICKMLAPMLEKSYGQPTF
jgi:SNF2 family DNA or RNA helicase